MGINLKPITGTVDIVSNDYDEIITLPMEDIQEKFRALLKPSGKDFEEFIKFSNSDQRIHLHEVNIPGLTISESINQKHGFSKSYGSIHFFAHTDGTYIFTVKKAGAYGVGGTTVTNDDFIHISTRPDIINLNATDYTTYSSNKIESEFLSKSEALAAYISRVTSTLVDDPLVDILSKGGIYAKNIINELKYDKGSIITESGRAGDTTTDSTVISPNVTLKFIDVAAGLNPDIVSDFNSITDTSQRTFIKGDIVVLRHDQSDRLDGEGVPLGTDLYMMIVEFTYEPKVYSLQNAVDELVLMTPVNLNSILSKTYTKSEVNALISASASGISGTVADTTELLALTGVVDGEQYIVTFIADGDSDIDNLPPGDINQGVVQASIASAIISWKFIYPLTFKHSHVDDADLPAVADWVFKSVNPTAKSLKLISFSEDPASVHVTSTMSTSWSTAANALPAITSKLATIAPSAEVNVQGDWTQSSSTHDAYIEHKPLVFPPSAHTHTGVYAPKTHTHSQYALKDTANTFTKTNTFNLDVSIKGNSIVSNSSAGTTLTNDGAKLLFRKTSNGNTATITTDGITLKFNPSTGSGTTTALALTVATAAVTVAPKLVVGSSGISTTGLITAHSGVMNGGINTGNGLKKFWSGSLTSLPSARADNTIYFVT